MGIFCIGCFDCIVCLLILASCIRLAAFPSVSCDRDRSCCDRQFFCSCYISIIVSFTGYPYIYSFALRYIACCDLCRILCPCSICFLVFNLQIVSICICCCRCSCRICVSVIYFCHICRSQCYILCDLCFCDCQCSRCLRRVVVCCYIYISLHYLEVISKCSCISSYICSCDLIAYSCCLSGYQSTGIRFIRSLYLIGIFAVLASGIRLTACPSVSCDRDRSCCDRQFLCVFQFTSIIFTSHTNFDRCTICYIGCCNLCRILCPCSVRFLIFDLDSIKICFCFLS